MGCVHITHDAPDNGILSFPPAHFNQAIDVIHALRSFCFKEQSRQDSDSQCGAGYWTALRRTAYAANISESLHCPRHSLVAFISLAGIAVLLL